MEKMKVLLMINNFFELGVIYTAVRESKPTILLIEIGSETYCTQTNLQAHRKPKMFHYRNSVEVEDNFNPLS